MADLLQTSDIHEQAADAFEQAPMWFVGTCDRTEANVIPVGFKWVAGGRLLIADFFFGKTRANLESHPRVAVSVGLLNPKRGFQVKAGAIVHRQGPVFEEALGLLARDGIKGTPHAVIEVPMEEIYLLNPGPQAGKRVE